MKRWVRANRGFTLVELSVAAFASVAIGAGVVVGLVNFSQRSARETSFSEVQTNLRRALQYVARDLKDAELVSNNAQLATETPTLTNGASVVRGVISLWQRRQVGAVNSHRQVVYYLTPPPANGIWQGPLIAVRVVYDYAVNPDTSADGFLSDAEAAAASPSVANIAFNDPRVQVLTDRLDAGTVVDPNNAAAVVSIGLYANVIANQNNQSVLLSITGDQASLAGNQSRAGGSMLDQTVGNQLRQQTSVSIRSR